MTLELSEVDIHHLARLARIALTEEEVGLFRGQIAHVMTYAIDLLAEISVQDVEPTAQTTGLVNVWQDDTVRPGLEQQQALSQAPQQKLGQFVVKKVLGDA